MRCFLSFHFESSSSDFHVAASCPPAQTPMIVNILAFPGWPRAYSRENDEFLSIIAEERVTFAHLVVRRRIKVNNGDTGYLWTFEYRKEITADPVCLPRGTACTFRGGLKIARYLRDRAPWDRRLLNNVENLEVISRNLRATLALLSVRVSETSSIVRIVGAIYKSSEISCREITESYAGKKDIAHITRNIWFLGQHGCTTLIIFV